MRRWLLVVVALAGCGDGVPRPAIQDPVSVAEAQELAQRFDAAMDPCDPSKIDAMVDQETLLRRAVQTIDATPAEKQQVLRESRAKLSVGVILCTRVAPGTAHDLLRIREVDGSPRPLFRVLMEGGVDYRELRLGKSRSDHRVRILDAEMFGTGQPISGVFAQMLSRGIASAHAGEDIAGSEGTMKAIDQARTSNDGATVRKLVATLPPTLRDSQPIRLSVAASAVSLGGEEYAAEIEAYRRSFPDDPAIDLLSLDAYYIRKDVPALLAALDRVDRRVGGDPYLDVLRASAYLLEPTPEHLAEAHRRALAVTRAEPALERGWLALLEVELHRKDHASTRAVLEQLEGPLHRAFDPDKMRATPFFASFVASPEFAAWLAARGG